MQFADALESMGNLEEGQLELVDQVCSIIAVIVLGHGDADVVAPVCNLEKALSILAFSRKASAKVWHRLLKDVVASQHELGNAGKGRASRPKLNKAYKTILTLDLSLRRHADSTGTLRNFVVVAQGMSRQFKVTFQQIFRELLQGAAHNLASATTTLRASAGGASQGVRWHESLAPEASLDLLDGQVAGTAQLAAEIAKMDYIELTTACPEILGEVPHGPEVAAADPVIELSRITWCERMCCQAMLRPASKRTARRCLAMTATFASDTGKDWKTLLHHDIVTLIEGVIDSNPGM